MKSGDSNVKALQKQHRHGVQSRMLEDLSLTTLESLKVFTLEGVLQKLGFLVAVHFVCLWTKGQRKKNHVFQNALVRVDKACKTVDLLQIRNLFVDWNEMMVATS